MTTIQIIILTTAIIGAVCGLLGATLGIMNSYFQIQRNKIKLKIIPKHCIPVGSLEGANIDFGIEVVNLSEFAVTITDVGFLSENGRIGTTATVYSIEEPEKLPIKLEPRTSYTKYFHTSACANVLSQVIRSAYAQTACGNRVEGTSPALKQLTNRYLKIRE